MRESKKEKTRNAILDASQQLFAKYGYNNVNMPAISAHAGIAVGTTYNYFASKGEILLELITSSSVSIKSEYDISAESKTDVKNSIIEVITNHLDFITDIDKSTWKVVMTILANEDLDMNDMKYRFINFDETYLNDLKDYLNLKEKYYKCDISSLINTVYSLLIGITIRYFYAEMSANDYKLQVKEQLNMIL